MKKIAIDIENLKYAYEKEKDFVLEGLNLQLLQGEITALVGDNGAGKTTLGKLICGILRPSGGRVKVFGEDIINKPLYEIGKTINYSFQSPEKHFFTTSVEEEIGFGLKYGGFSKEQVKEIVEEKIKLFKLESVRDEFPLNISFGEKRRLALAISTALSPRYLVLDEPTTGLDDLQVGVLEKIIGEFKESGIGVLFISHHEEFIERIADRVLTLKGGQITNDLRP